MLKQILNSINFYFFKLQSQFDEIRGYSFYTKDFMTLINKLQLIFDQLYNKFLKNNKLLHEKIEKINKEDNISTFYHSHYEKDIKIFFPHFTTFNSFFELLKKSKESYINRGIFITIKYFLKKISKDVRFIIIPEFEFNYCYLDISNEINRFTSILDIPAEKIRSFLLFTIPYFNPEDLFSSTLLGHEIGHYIEEELEIWKKNFEPEMLSKKMLYLDKIKNIVEYQFKKELDIWVHTWGPLSGEAQKSFKDLLYRKTQDKCLTELTKKTKAWVKEIISDKIGLKIFGLPYFFAYIDLIFLTNPKSLGDEDHPPNWLRLQYLVNELRKKRNWETLETKLVLEETLNGTVKQNNIGEKIIEIIKFLERHFMEVDLSNEDPFNKVILKEIIIPDILEKKIDDALKELVKSNKIKEFSYIENFKKISVLIQLLRRYITPNEIIDIGEQDTYPTNILNIINAGWFFLLFQMNYHFKIFNMKEENYSTDKEIQMKRMDVHQKLNNLILKAIELSNIHQKFKNKTQ